MQPSCFRDSPQTAVQYIRCSTSEQRKSGLGLQAQDRAVREFCEREGLEITHSFQETMSGKDDDRPELAKALAAAKETGGFVVVAKLCRLSRRVSKISSLMESGVPFIVAELGKDVDSMVLHLFASFAEAEAARISRRTKEALAEKKAQGFKLGSPNIEKAQATSREVRSRLADQFAWEMKPLVDACKKVGMTTMRAIAAHLNEIEKPTRRGGKWSPEGVRRLLIRIDRLTEARNRAAHGVEDDGQKN